MIDFYEIKKNAESLRTEFYIDQLSPIDVFNVVSTRPDYTLVFRPFSEKISGMCVKANENKIIVVNTIKTVGRQRFSVAHELYHLNFQPTLSPIICEANIEDVTKPVDEIKADYFASFFLIPSEALRRYVTMFSKKDQKLGLFEIILLEQLFKVSRQAILVRLVSEGFINREIADSLKGDVRKTAVEIGFDETLYKKSPPEREFYTSGSFLRLSKELVDAGKLSQGEFREMLAHAYRYDLIHSAANQEVTSYD